MTQNSFDFPNLEFLDVLEAEGKLIRKLSTNRENQLEFNLFSNLLLSPVGHEGYEEYNGFYLFFEILRKDLGFLPDKKPGDIDVLIVPFSEDKIYFDRTCAFEVKVVRPRRSKPRKSPNSFGISQVTGLIEDGFPLVGLIHLCMPEPLKEEEKASIQYDHAILDIDNPSANQDFGKRTSTVKYDQFSGFSAENQMRKLISKDIPKYVGLKTVGVNTQKGGGYTLWYNHGFNMKYESGFFNPNMQSSTIEKIKDFFHANVDSAIQAMK